MYVCKVHPELCFFFLFGEISLLLLPFISSSPVFSTAAMVFLSYVLVSIFSNHLINSNRSRLCLHRVIRAKRMLVVESLCFFFPRIICTTTVAAAAATAAAAVLKNNSFSLLHNSDRLISAHSLLFLAIIKELLRDCSRASGEPREYPKSLSVNKKKRKKKRDSSRPRDVPRR